ncbi:hypothetical protein N2152v2_003733 [Parachlorella kessleri]
MQRSQLVTLLLLLTVVHTRAQTAGLEAGGPDVFYAVANLAGKNMVPEPINTTAMARLALALGKDSAVYFLEVFDILEFAMSHLHMVSPGTGTLHTGTLQGARGANGPAFIQLAPAFASAQPGADMLHTMYTPPLSGKMSIVNTFNASDIHPPSGTMDMQALKDAILKGNVYTAVHNTTTPVGLIRDQLQQYKPRAALPWE